jgi:hypothetical protein
LERPLKQGFSEASLREFQGESGKSKKAGNREKT